MRSLWPSGIDYESQKNQNPRRVPDTCLWTLENSKYIKWRDDDTKKLLWISADPGCGKSVLARCIIDEDLPEAFQNDSSKRILYYFFNNTSPEQRSITRAISMILHQLFASQPRLIRYALPSYREVGEALFTFSKLWSIFTAAATDPLAGNVFCVLDALDECDEQEQVELIKALEDFCLHQQSPSSPSSLKLLITSRPYFQIRREFDKLLQSSDNIELAGNDESVSMKKEVDLFIKHSVAKLALENRLRESVSDYLKKRLLETENRTYLWLRLIWVIIKKNLSGTIREMNELIDNLPSGIQDSYETLLQRCPDRSFAKKVLQIVLVACRPLTLDEIDLALGVNEQTLSYADLEREGFSRLQETLPSRCGLMVSIIGSRVYFIHQTVKEFLLGEVSTKPPAGRIWQQSLDLGESHNLMAEICLRSISFSEIQLDQANLCNALLPEDDRELEPNAYCRSYVFLSYSAIYWAQHSRDQKLSKGMKTIEHILGISDCRPTIGRYGRDYGTTLHAASLGGHEKIVQMLLDKGVDVNAQGGRYGHALQAASVRGHDQVVRMLLDKGADVNAQGGEYGSALPAASAGGHEAVVRLLLYKGADVNAGLGHFGSALQAASAGDHQIVIRLLIDRGALVNSLSKYRPSGKDDNDAASSSSLARSTGSLISGSANSSLLFSKHLASSVTSIGNEPPEEVFTFLVGEFFLGLELKDLFKNLLEVRGEHLFIRIFKPEVREFCSELRMESLSELQKGAIRILRRYCGYFAYRICRLLEPSTTQDSRQFEELMQQIPAAEAGVEKYLHSTVGSTQEINVGETFQSGSRDAGDYIGDYTRDKSHRNILRGSEFIDESNASDSSDDGADRFPQSLTQEIISWLTESSLFRDFKDRITRSICSPFQHIEEVIQPDPSALNMHLTTLHIDWELIRYTETELGESQQLSTVLVVSGGVIDAEASPCLEYCRRVWPLTGEFVVKALEKAIKYGSYGNQNFRPLAIAS